MDVLHKEFYSKLSSNFNHILAHENIELQEKARQLIKLDDLMIRTFQKIQECKLDISYFKELLVISSMNWFKNDFFTWTDMPKCEMCGLDTVSDGPLKPNSEDYKYGASRVEGYRCSVNCSSHITRFPRYNSPLKLLQTRTGRCGEWANCFLLFLRAIGIEARLIVDWTDHVWNEVYIDRMERWVHIDVCEEAWDKPLLYEIGWGKKLTYCISFSKDDIQDVTWKYCQNHALTLTCRSACKENWLISTILSMRRQRQQNFSAQICQQLNTRLVCELVEMLVEPSKNGGQQLSGRTTGSIQWRLDRNELGLTAQLIEYIISPSISECECGFIEIKYDSNSDSYLRGDEVIKSWNSCLYSFNNVFRKVEKDWKKTYLCRTENCLSTNEGHLSWKFHLPNVYKIRSLQVSVATTMYEDAKVTCEMMATKNKILKNIAADIPNDCGDEATGQLICDDDAITHSETTMMTLSQTFGVNIKDVLQEVEKAAGFQEVEIKLKFEGGVGDVAWQHAQICRQDLDEKSPPNFTLHFLLKFGV